jgi:hypothetical protein
VEHSPDARPPRPLWRLLAASPLPFLALLWALWRDVYMLDTSGVQRVGGPGAVAEWAFLTVASVAVVASLWAPTRPLRVLGCTLHALVLSFAFGVAGVLAVMHGLGGPDGDLSAPTWALMALALLAALCVAALLATAALIVEDVRAAEERS